MIENGQSVQVPAVMLHHPHRNLNLRQHFFVSIIWTEIIRSSENVAWRMHMARDLCTRGCTLERDTVVRTWVRMRHTDQEVWSGYVLF